MAGMNRIASINRKTKETQISLTLNIDGTGICDVDSPIGFFLHMLNSFCTHGLFDIVGTLRGDLEVDQHHLIEDTGIVLGKLFQQALGDYKGINRAGFFVYPMDEALLQAAVDFGGRGLLVCNARLSNTPLVSGGNSFQTDCFQDFWQAFASNAACSLHLDTIRGRSDHHIMEGLFKAASRAIRQACSIDPRRQDAIPSTKGVIV